MEWIGAVHDKTNWCRLDVSWKQTDQMVIPLSSVDAVKERYRLLL